MELNHYVARFIIIVQLSFSFFFRNSTARKSTLAISQLLRSKLCCGCKLATALRRDATSEQRKVCPNMGFSSRKTLWWTSSNEVSLRSQKRIPSCATINHFLLTLELEIELEFDGLLCIVTRAILYSTKLMIFAIVKQYFLSLILDYQFSTQWRAGQLCLMLKFRVDNSKHERFVSVLNRFILVSFFGHLSLK